MASVKLVTGHNYYHSHIYPHLLRTTNQPQQIMTLDDSLPRSSTSTDYDPGSDSARDMSSPPSPVGSESRDPHSLSETPTKKNKRKLSEPKKRTDITTKKQPQSNSIANQEDTIQKTVPAKKLTNGRCQRSLSKPSGKVRNNGIKRDTSSSSSSLSNNDIECNKDNPLVSLSNVITPPFLSPMFTGVPPSTFGYVPGLFLPGRTYPRQGIHTSFPSIPLNCQQNYITATASAGSHSSSSSLATPAATPSLYSLTVARLANSKLEAGVSEISQHDQTPTSTNQPVPSSIPASHPSSFSVLHLQPSILNRPSSSRNNEDDDDDDDEDDEALSSRAPSPEDLSVGGKMSRKHRKNYKNMTRERRVEANARERTRVHTISAAFDALRRAVPSYSHNQKLSKLAILRIASSYILALARLNDKDYTSASDHIGKSLTFSECVDLCTNTIQTEGRARRRH